MSGNVLKRIGYLGLAIELGTESVPDDGRYHVTKAGQVIKSTGSLTIAAAYLELFEEEILAEHPEIVPPRELLNRERAFSDILAVRGEARSRARLKSQAKGGKGGRGGV